MHVAHVLLFTATKYGQWLPFQEIHHKQAKPCLVPYFALDSFPKNDYSGPNTTFLLSLSSSSPFSVLTHENRGMKKTTCKEPPPHHSRHLHSSFSRNHTCWSLPIVSLQHRNGAKKKKRSPSVNLHTPSHAYTCWSLPIVPLEPGCLVVVPMPVPLDTAASAATVA